MNIIIENERLKSVVKKVTNIPETEKHDVYIGLGSIGEAIAFTLSLAKRKPCITRELVERSGRTLERELKLLPLISAEYTKNGELHELIKRYRIRGFQISTLIALKPIESEKEKELKMLGVKVMQVDY